MCVSCLTQCFQVGFGLGLSAAAIQRHGRSTGVTEHVILEANEMVMAKALKIHGKWWKTWWTDGENMANIGKHVETMVKCGKTCGKTWWRHKGNTLGIVPDMIKMWEWWQNRRKKCWTSMETWVETCGTTWDNGGKFGKHRGNHREHGGKTRTHQRSAAKHDRLSIPWRKSLVLAHPGVSYVTWSPRFLGVIPSTMLV